MQRGINRFLAILIACMVLTSGAYAQQDTTSDDTDAPNALDASLPTDVTAARTHLGLGSGECDVASGMTGVGCGLVLDTNTYQAARSDPGTASDPIDPSWNSAGGAVYGPCRYVDNVGTTAIFVPFKSANDWASFANNQQFNTGINKSATIAAMPCARPGWVTVPYAKNFTDSKTSKSYQCLNPDVATKKAAMDYGRTGSTQQQSVTFTCCPVARSADGTCPPTAPVGVNDCMSETATVTATGLNSDTYQGSIAPGPTITGPYAWSLNATTYQCTGGSPGICGAADDQYFTKAPVAKNGLCSYGTASVVTPVTATGPWSWSCASSGGAAQCQTSACGSANGSVSYTTPTALTAGTVIAAKLKARPTLLCMDKTQPVVTGQNNYQSSGETLWTWTCDAGTPSQSQCQTGMVGVCDNTAITRRDGHPASGPLCQFGAAGTISAMDVTGPWNWTCTGAGTSAFTKACISLLNPCALSGLQNANSPLMSTKTSCTAKTGQPCYDPIAGKTYAASGSSWAVTYNNAKDPSACYENVNFRCINGKWNASSHSAAGGTFNGGDSSDYQSYACDSCFPPDTPVLTPDRGWVPISHIKEGDVVVSVDNEGKHVDVIVKGLQITPDRKLRRINGIEISTLQKVQLATGKYVVVLDLKVGDVLVDTEGHLHPIYKLIDEKGLHTVYNLIFDSHDTPFFAAGVKVKDWQ